MSEETSETWAAGASGRDRVRHVVELLEAPTPVTEIAERADVARATADDELRRLKRDDWVTETTADGKKAYDLNPVRLLFDEISSLIDRHSRAELEVRLTTLTEREESLATESDVDSLEGLHERVATEELTADELREIRNAIDTWEALRTEIDLCKHALALHGDVTRLSTPGVEDGPSLHS